MNDEKADRPTREAVERALKLLDGSVLAAEVRALRAEHEPYEVLAPQSCAAGKHPEWLIDSEHSYACPWCQIEALRAELVDALDVAERLRSQREKLHQDVDRVAAELTARADGPALAARTPQSAEGEIDERCTPEEEAHDEMCPGCVTCLHPDAAPLPAVPDGSVTLDELSQPDPSLALVTDRDAALARMVDAAARWPEGSDQYIVPVPLGWLRALSVPAVPDGEDAAVDEMEGHFIDANERMGEALVAIGMALGLPRPSVGATWGAPEILARIAQWNGSLGSCYDHSILGHDDARVAAPVVGCSDCLDALTTPLPAGEDVPARLDAAAEVLNHLVPLSCAGGDLRRIGVALRLMPVEVRAAVAAALARPTGGQG